jgi:glycopeptide antibiotics resistance protein
MARLTDGTPNARLTLAFDLVAIVAFIGVGMTSHHDDPAARIFLRNLIPFTVAWLVTAWFVGTYRPVANRSLLLTIVIAIPAGVLLRVAWVRAWDAGDLLTFAGVALLFSAVFLGVGRMLSTAIGDRLFGAPAARGRSRPAQ